MMNREQLIATLILHGWTQPMISPGYWTGVLNRNGTLMYSYPKHSAKVGTCVKFAEGFADNTDPLCAPNFDAHLLEYLQAWVEEITGLP
jgi:hypothetical protein